MASTLGSLPDGKLTGFALHLALAGHTDIPRENDFDFLAEAESVFAPARPKKTASNKARQTTAIKDAAEPPAKPTPKKVKANKEICSPNEMWEPKLAPAFLHKCGAGEPSSVSPVPSSRFDRHAPCGARGGAVPSPAPLPLGQLPIAIANRKRSKAHSRTSFACPNRMRERRLSLGGRWTEPQAREAPTRRRSRVPLAIERGAAGLRYPTVAEEGVPSKEVADVIGRRLNLPVVAKSLDEAADGRRA